jgi:transposase
MAKVTDAQVKELWRHLSKEASLRQAAMKAGMDRKTARKYRKGQLPSQSRVEHTWRTRPDPLTEVWPELQAELERSPGLQGRTLLALLQDRYPGRYPDGLLRTVQRRVKHWRATSGPAKEVFFAQVHEPGRLGASDFTHLSGLGITIQGRPFAHLAYHFVLTYSNWEYVRVCLSESFASLSEGLQGALQALGGVPRRHRTDRMSMAVHQDGNAEAFTQRYRALLAHYGMQGEATNPASGHENGDCEQGHRRFKEALEQALLVRGSREFVSRESYASFVAEVVARRNRERGGKLAEEQAVLGELPSGRIEVVERLRVKVCRGSTIRVKGNVYSVPARLIGEWLEAQVGSEEIVLRYGGQEVERLERLRGKEGHRVAYRHIIDWLVKKPGAFAQYRYQADLFPGVIFRRAYDELLAARPERSSREYVRLLYLASRHGEDRVEEALRRLWSEGRGISAMAVEKMVSSDSPLSLAASVQVQPVDLRMYDTLLVGFIQDAEQEAEQETEQEAGQEVEHKEVCDGEGSSKERSGGEGGEASGAGSGTGSGAVLTGAASAGDADAVRGSGASGAAGELELCGLFAGAGGERVPAAKEQPRGAHAAGLEAAAGEELAGAGSEASAGQGGAAVAELAGGGLLGSARERAGVWAAGSGQDALPGGAGAGTGASGAAGAVHDMHLAGAGIVGGEARVDAQGVAQAAGTMGGVADRRSGICSAEPGGDGGAVHAAGGAL